MLLNPLTPPVVGIIFIIPGIDLLRRPGVCQDSCSFYG